MIYEAPKPPPRAPILIPVVTAALTTIATGLVTWGIDELRARYGSNRQEKPSCPE